jgi:crotonobetainyl-CoA:carnitine CoA-transferase CaiB-like acyl-CoA transferase
MTSSSPDTGLPTPLGGTVAVDLSTGIAGQYAGRLLAMYGATVVLVEPPDGTPTRRMAPLDPAGRHSYLFRHLNQGKQSVVVDTSRDDHVGVLRDLLGRADIVLRDQGSTLPADLAETVVDCEIGEFPAGTPYEGWLGGEMVQQALGGVMNATGSAAREPIYGVGHRAAYATGTTAYISVLAALHERHGSGRGQAVRATVFESAAAMGQNLVSQFSYNGTSETRARYPGFLAILRCQDAWIVLFAIRNWPALCQVFGLAELLDDPRFTTSGDRLANWPAVTDMLQQRASSMVADDVVAACQRGRISAEKVLSLGELVDSEQWRVRSILHEVISADGGTETALHQVFSISGTATGVPSASPPLPVDLAASGSRS